VTTIKKRKRKKEFQSNPKSNAKRAEQTKERGKSILSFSPGLHAEALSVEPALGVKKRTRLSERSEGVCSF